MCIGNFVARNPLMIYAVSEGGWVKLELYAHIINLAELPKFQQIKAC